MTSITFPRLVGAGVAACLAAGIAHQGYATLMGRRHHDGFEADTLRCATGNIVTYYVRRGDSGGPTVVLEAGLISTSLIWRLVADHLPPSITVVLYDRAGYRRSLRRCPEEYCLQESVRDLADLVRAVADPGAPCLLAGHSLGGYLAYRAAATMPDRVDGLVLIDPNHPRELVVSQRQREGARGPNLTLKLAPLTALLGGGLLMDKKGIMARAEGNPYYWQLRLEASTYAMWHTGLREWRYSYAYMLDGGSPLEKLPLPVSVLAAEVTTSTIPEHVDLYEEYVASGSGGEIVTIPGVDHQSILTGYEGARLTAAEIEKLADRVCEQREKT